MSFNKTRVFLIKTKNSKKVYYTFAYDLEDLYCYFEQQIEEPLDWSSLLEDGIALTEVIRLHQEYRTKTSHKHQFSPHVVYLDRNNNPFMKK